MRIFSVIVLGITAFALPCANAAEKKPVRLPPSLTKQLDCMVRVVKAAPDTDHAKWGVGKEVMDRDQPFVTWHYSGIQGSTYIRFDGQGTVERSFHETLSYLAIFPNGVMPEGKDGKPVPGWKPYDWGADKIIGGWKASCGVHATILSF